MAGAGAESEEKTVAMTANEKGTYTGRIPAPKAAPLLRFRIHAVDNKGGERFYPHENDLRPALSVYAHPKFTPDKIPYGMVFNVGAGKAAAAPVRLPFFNFGRSGGSLVHQYNQRQGCNRLGRISVERFPRIFLALQISDGSVIKEQVRRRDAFALVALGAVAEVEQYLLRS